MLFYDYVFYQLPNMIIDSNNSEYSNKDMYDCLMRMIKYGQGVFCKIVEVIGGEVDSRCR